MFDLFTPSTRHFTTVLMFAAALSLVAWSCTPTEAPSEQIALAQKAYSSDKTEENGLLLVEALLDHVNEHKEDPEAKASNAKLLAQAADIAGEVNASQQRAVLQHIYIRDFYDQPETPRMIFELGETFEENKNEMAAIALYKGLNTAFPNNSYALKAKPKADAVKDDLNTVLNNMAINIFRKDNAGIRQEIASSFVNVSEAYALTMPDDKHSAIVLHRAAEVARSLQDMGKSLNIYDWILHRYPEDSLSSNALFFKAQILDDHFQKEEEAEKIYKEFIAKYPKHPFAEDAQFLIDMLGKTDEEKFQEILSKQKTQ